MSKGLQLWRFIAIFLIISVSSVRADELGDFLAIAPSPEQAWLLNAEKLIKDGTDDVRILQLRLAYLSQIIGTGQNRNHFTSCVAKLDELIRNANGRDDVISYRAAIIKGLILDDCLGDYVSSFLLYKELESHPHLANHDLATDFDRTSLYLKMASSAMMLKKNGEAEKYSSLVMVYPFLGLEDRTKFVQFNDLYERAGNIYISAVSNNLNKLREVEIYPSHPKLVSLRSMAISSYLKVNIVTSKNLSADVSKSLGHQVAGSAKAKLVAGATDSRYSLARRNINYVMAWGIAAGISIFLLMVAYVFRRFVNRSSN